ncbi:hypothetical protein Tco_0303079 [Tanacetum coccineum]
MNSLDHVHLIIANQLAGDCQRGSQRCQTCQYMPSRRTEESVWWIYPVDVWGKNGGKDRLLEASLAEDVKNLVITSCVEIRNKDLHDEIERISKESKDVSNESKTADTVCNDFEVTQELSKRIVELEKDLSKFKAKSIAFEVALQHKSRENNSLKILQ